MVGQCCISRRVTAETTVAESPEERSDKNAIS